MVELLIIFLEIEMLSRYPAFIVGIGLILLGLGCFYEVYNGNFVNLFISIGIIIVVVGIVWDSYI
jgi:hypothetical protein